MNYGKRNFPSFTQHTNTHNQHANLITEAQFPHHHSHFLQRQQNHPSRQTHITQQKLKR
jgi:hypothetical protein